MIQAMYSGVSGMKAFKTQLDVIGNNIANLNTVGFKGSRVTFQEMMSQTLKNASGPSGNQGGVNPMQVGLGVNIGQIDVSQIQGSLQSTGKLTDCAIEGNGFFMLSKGSSILYSRDGTFNVDGDYNLVNASGMPVLGWVADVNGNIDETGQVTPASGIKIPIGQISSARATSTVSLGGNLDANQDAAAAGPHKTLTVNIYDSLGVSHNAQVAFTKTGPSTWSYAISSTEGAFAGVTNGTIEFNANGSIDSINGNPVSTNGSLLPLTFTLTTPNGSIPTDFNIDLGKVGQLSGEYTISTTSQDGLPKGTLESFTVAKDGTIIGIFTNGNMQTLAKIALAQFANPAGLNKVGGNLLSESPNSGVAQVGSAGTGSFGKLSAGFLESSNVDLSAEFSNMIVAQRGFQANSRIITVSDEVLQELVSLKR
jgi:flagellar hook protein FlgE